MCVKHSAYSKLTVFMVIFILILRVLFQTVDSAAIGGLSLKLLLVRLGQLVNKTLESLKHEIYLLVIMLIFNGVT